MSDDKRTCPCKRLPLCLSSFTAAEYGDLHSLSRLDRESVNRTDAGGYTPLHLSAQNGHVGATAFLLALGADVDSVGGCGATPLHRSAFSGAVPTMQILLGRGCDLLVRDMSFGDEMTPLHKAAAGGRYLAVQLLLNALRIRTRSTVRDNLTGPSLLQQGLRARDSLGRTPLDIAIELSRNQREERSSVQRWDAVAGGTADWDRCIQLLQAAEDEVAYSTATEHLDENETCQKMALPAPPRHLTTRESCLDCGGGSDGCCLTASWEDAFRSVLTSLVDDALEHKPMVENESSGLAEVGTPPQDMCHSEPTSSDGDAAVSEPMKPALGRKCDICGDLSIAMYPKGKQLVCRKCAKPARPRRMGL